MAGIEPAIVSSFEWKTYGKLLTTISSAELLLYFACAVTLSTYDEMPTIALEIFT
jgi:hypothetical protein